MTTRRYFSTISLFLYLLVSVLKEQVIRATDTIKTNPLGKDLTISKTDIKIDERRLFSGGNGICVVTWYDNDLVTALSNLQTETYHTLK